MAEEKNTEKSEDPAAQAKGMVEQFVQTLGLVDLIIGALVLYWARLWFGSKVASVLESTGYEWLDVALLACAAAFVGKVVSLIAELLAAIKDVMRSTTKGHYKRLVDALNAYQVALKSNPNNDIGDQIDRATAYVLNANPRLQPELERLYNATTLAYSMTMVAFLFALYFWTKKDLLLGAGIPILGGLLVIVIAFVVLGILKQNDYLDTLTDNLNYATAKLNLESTRLERGETRAATPLSLALSSIPNLSVQITTQSISVDVVRAIEQHKEKQ